MLPRARVHVSVVAHLAAAHYSEHLPFYRIEQQLARTGVTLARSTQVALMTRLDALVAPLVAHLKTAVLGSGYVHLDATPVDVCDPARPGRAREATLWAYRARSADPAIEGLVWFEYQPSKSPTHPRAVLAAYRGVLQTDGAAGLGTLGMPNEVVHLGCWAHARRRFFQALRLGETRAGPYVAQLDRLFRLDARARRVTAARPDHAARVATWRARFLVPLAEALFIRATADGLVLPPKSALRQAVGYLLAQRAPLFRCVTTPGARLDNNAVENAIRPVKLGAKNWLFVGHPDAGPRLANLFTLVENARQAGVDIEAYLTALLTQLPDHSVRRLGSGCPAPGSGARTRLTRPPAPSASRPNALPAGQLHGGAARVNPSESNAYRRCGVTRRTGGRWRAAELPRGATRGRRDGRAYEASSSAPPRGGDPDMNGNGATVWADAPGATDLRELLRQNLENAHASYAARARVSPQREHTRARTWQSSPHAEHWR